MTNAEFPLLSLILFTPLVGVGILMFVNKQSGDLIRWIANIFAGLGFLVSLPRRVREGELVEVRFAASVYLQSTRFGMSLEDSRDGQQIRQRVDAGDANPDVESNSTVVSIPVSAHLFADIDITPDILTANGDGRNDELSVHVDLVNVLSPRPLSLRLYDLAGHLVYRDERLVTAGEHKLTWNGRVEGRLVAPGLYVLVVSLEGDAQVQKEHRVVAVVY